MSETPTNPTLSYATPKPAKPSMALIWTGRVVTTLVGLMLLMGGVMDLMKPEFVVKGVTEAGYREEVVVPLGVVTVISCILFFIPQTMLLGAMLLTGYLGGAVATHVRMGQYGQMIAPFVFAVVMWIGVLLREPRLRSLLPLRKI